MMQPTQSHTVTLTLDVTGHRQPVLTWLLQALRQPLHRQPLPPQLQQDVSIVLPLQDSRRACWCV